MTDDPVARALQLLELLQSGGRTAEQLAARLNTSTRTVRRDVHRLRSLGYAVDAPPGPGSAYRLAPGVRMPPLLFTADEITVIVAGLHLVRRRLPGDAVSGAVLQKLEQALPDGLRRRARATDLATEVLEQADAPASAAAVGVIADAVAGNGRVRFDYRDQHGVSTQRVVEPYRHVLRSGRSYLVAYDVHRADWRLFRLDRVTSIEPVSGTFRGHEFPAASLERWLTTDFGRVESGAPS